MELIDERFTPDFVFYRPGSFESGGIEDFKGFLGMFQTAFPDAEWNLQDLVAEGEKVAFYVTFRGTHNAPLGDIPPTGRKVEAIGFGIFTVRDGKLAALRGLNDHMGLMQQLGVTSGRN